MSVVQKPKKLFKNLIFAVILVILAGALPAQASLCSFYKEYFPALYSMNCTGGSKSMATSGAGSNSSVAQSLNINPGGLPTEPTPYGLETIGSYIRGSNPTSYGPSFSLVKGFRKIGTGFSTSGNNTFYGNDIVERAGGSPNVQTFKSPETAKGKGINLNLGSSVALISPQKGSSFSLNLGFSGRYNKITNTVGGGTGIGVNANIFHFGVGAAQEKISNYLPAIDFFSSEVGIKLPLIEFEYTVLKNLGGAVLRPIQIGTATLTLGPVMISGAVRWLNYLQAGDVSQKHIAVQFHLSQHWSVGYLYNYIPGASSAAVQLFL